LEIAIAVMEFVSGGELNLVFNFPSSKVYRNAKIKAVSTGLILF